MASFQWMTTKTINIPGLNKWKIAILHPDSNSSRFPLHPKRRLGCCISKVACSFCLLPLPKGLAKPCLDSDSPRGSPAASPNQQLLKLICFHLAGKQELFLTWGQNTLCDSNHLYGRCPETVIERSKTKSLHPATKNLSPTAVPALVPLLPPACVDHSTCTSSCT